MQGSEAATLDALPATLARLRAGFDSGKTKSVEWRKEQLHKVIAMCQKHRDEIATAMSKDLGNLPSLANFLEIGATIQEAELALKNLDEWMAPEKRSLPITVRPAKGYMVKEPYGVVLIVGPWNYPFRLLSFPLIGALAAGNTVLIKPSEVAANTSAAIKRAIGEFFTPDAVAVVEGGVAVSQALLANRFDYIFYTGNTEVGRIVMRAASEHLTPVTLELGGKSPVYIDKSAKLDLAVNRILFGKFTNNGQTCVAPDYVLVHKSIKEPLIAKLKERIVQWYGPDASKARDYSRIINPRHTERLTRVIDEVRPHVVFGGKTNPTDRYVEPTLIVEPPLSSSVMREEIFGPLLPIVGVDGPAEAIKFINSREKPLALYIFSEDSATTQNIIRNTSSGGVGVNQTLMHVGCSDLDFGGVGHSGMGAYNGRRTFDTFSHHRTVLDKATWIEIKSGYPPLTPKKLEMLDKLADGIKIPTKKIATGAILIAAAAAYAIRSRL